MSQYDGTGVYKDEFGLNITLKSNTDGTYTIKDKKDNELIFASFAKLKSIKDNKGNVLTLNFNSSNVLESAVDGVGRKTTLELDSGDKLTGIVDPSGKMPMRVPVKLGTFKQVVNFLEVAGVVSFSMSLVDNFSGKYSKGEAWARTVIDVRAFAAGIAFTAGGGWVAVGVGLGIGILSEGAKDIISLWCNRKVTN